MQNMEQNQRTKLYRLLGKLPPLNRNIQAAKTGEEEFESFFLERWILDLNGEEPVPAYFLRSKTAAGKAPAILYHHSHGGNYGIGKDELLTGAAYLESPAYGEVLTAMGYHVLCFDTWAFGKRSTRTESELFKEMLWKGQVMWGMMVYDSLRAVDYLLSRQDVDQDRIGTMGISMGSTLAWWLAALDERIKVTVDLCCLTDFQALIEERGLDEHGIYYYVPDLLNHFTTAQINALIAPRPHLALAGNFDPLTPVAGLIWIDEELRMKYREYGMEHAWKMLRYDVGHMETDLMRKEVLSFLREWL